MPLKKLGITRNLEWSECSKNKLRPSNNVTPMQSLFTNKLLIFIPHIYLNWNERRFFLFFTWFFLYLFLFFSTNKYRREMRLTHADPNALTEEDLGSVGFSNFQWNTLFLTGILLTYSDPYLFTILELEREIYRVNAID